MGGIAAYATGRRRAYDQVLKEALLVLIELQHRGQESAGIAVAGSGGEIDVLRKRSPVFSLLWKLSRSRSRPERESFGCVAHVGDAALEELSQPVVFGDERFRVAVASDGCVSDYREIHLTARRLAPDVIPNHAWSPTHALAQAVYALAREERWDAVEALKRLSEHVAGTYSLVLLTSEPRLVIARGPRGLKPLAYSYAGDEFYAASETSALQVLDRDWREVEPGEILSFDGGSLETTSSGVPADPSPCVFEYVYISRPDSYFNGISVYTSRLRMGELLAKEAPVEADAVVPVPESGRVAAIGYSRASGIPLVEGIVINKYVGRVFIAAPERRDLISKLKHGIVRSAVEGKSVVVIDDSIVRGTTLGFLLEKLRRGGAEELHLRIASPPFRCPCYANVSIATREELLAWGKSDMEEIRKLLGADSLVYNTPKNLVLSVGLSNVCLSCFTCRYALQVEEPRSQKQQVE